MFQKWLYEFSGYFNKGSSPSLKMKGIHIEASINEAAQVYYSKYQVDPFGERGNFDTYWGLVQYSLIQKGMIAKEFDELTQLAKSFNEANDWF